LRQIPFAFSLFRFRLCILPVIIGHHAIRVIYGVIMPRYVVRYLTPHESALGTKPTARFRFSRSAIPADHNSINNNIVITPTIPEPVSDPHPKYRHARELDSSWHCRIAWTLPLLILMHSVRYFLSCVFWSTQSLNSCSETHFPQSAYTLSCTVICGAVLQLTTARSGSSIKIILPFIYFFLQGVNVLVDIDVSG
jgi:hypothetical protein